MFNRIYNIIKNKILNNISKGDFQLTEEENIIFNNSFDLQNLFIAEISKNIKLFKNYLYYCNEYIYNKLSKNFNNEVNYLKILRSIEEGESNKYYLSKDIINYNIDDVTSKKLLKKLEEFYHNSNLINIIDINNYYQIIDLINYQRYDVLQKKINLPEKLKIEEIIKIWPNNVHIPINIIEIDETCINYSKYFSYNNLFNNIEQNNLNILLKKINEKDDIDEPIILSNRALSVIENLKLINNNAYNQIVNFLTKYNNEYQKIFYIKTPNDLITRLNYIEDEIELEIFLVKNEELKPLLKNELVIKYLLKKGYYENLVQFNLINENNSNLIISNKFNICNKFSIPTIFSNYLALAIVKNNKIKTLSINENYVIDDFNLNLLEEILKNNPNIKPFHINAKIDSQVFVLLLKYHKLNYNFYNIRNLFTSKYKLELLKDKTLLIKYLNLNGFSDDIDLLNEVRNDYYLSSKVYRNIKSQINCGFNLDYNKIKYILLNQLEIKLSKEISIEVFDKIVSKLHLNNKDIIKLIENSTNININMLLTSSNEQLDKILNLFDTDNYSIFDLRSAYESLLQYEFANKNKDTINIFQIFKEHLDNNNIEEITIILNKMISVDDITVNNILKKYRIDLSKEEFIQFIIKLIKTKQIYLKKYNNQTNSSIKNRNLLESIVHDLSQNYIKISREKYSLKKLTTIENDLKLIYDLNKDDLIEQLMLTIINKDLLFNDKLDEELNNIMEYIKTILLKETNIDVELLKNVFNFLNGKQVSNFNRIKPIIKIVKKTLKEIIKNTDLEKTYIFYPVLSKNINRDKIRKKYIFKSSIDIVDLLEKIDMKILIDEILSNEEIYNELLRIMLNKKIHQIPINFYPIFDKEFISININENNISDKIAAFITNFKTIINSNLHHNQSLCNILTIAEAYSCYSNIYDKILTPEDSKLIELDAGANKSYYKKSLRLDAAVKTTIQLFQRKYITVPPISKVFKLKNNKEITVSVGNFTNPYNLTHGERTNSCMRLYGQAHSLFNFCLTNENGFNITFEDSNTKKYISRVSGFRNGNTIFLNQLRESCISEFKNEDLMEALEIFTNLLINESKKSSYPIDNVVITDGFAMKKSRLPKVQIDATKIHEGLSFFYTDIKNEVILLSTKELVPINYNKENVPRYEVLREQPKIYYNNFEEAINLIVRIDAIKKILNLTDISNYHYIDTIEPKDIKYAIVGDDWYIYVDKYNHIYSDYINTKEEMTNYLEQIRNKIGEDYGKKNRHS